MITQSGTLMFGGSNSPACSANPIYLTINNYSGTPFAIGIWLTHTQAQDLTAHLSALTREEPESAPP